MDLTGAVNATVKPRPTIAFDDQLNFIWVRYPERFADFQLSGRRGAVKRKGRRKAAISRFSAVTV
jgi:hypothetical protein